MRFHPRRFYTHKRMLDAVIYVTRVIPLPRNEYKLKVRWFLRSGADLNQTEEIKITNHELKYWYEYVTKT